MFADKGQSFNGLKHLTEKVTAVASLTHIRVVVNHTMPTPLQRTTKLRFRTYILISVFTPSRLHLVKNILSTHFFYVFFHSLPFTEMLIVNGKLLKLNLTTETTLLLMSGLHRC